MNAELGNNSVVSTSSYSNMAINYQLLTGMSREDEQNFGTTIGFSKDEPLSMRYLSVANGTGLGEVNNIITRPNFDPTLGYGASAYQQNQGRLNRMINSTSYDVAMENTENLAQVIASGKNYSQRDALVQNPGVITGRVVNYYTIAMIPLHMLCDLFAKMPLVKRAYLKITLNLNANCSTTIVNNATGTHFVSPYMNSPISITGKVGFNAGATALTTSCMLSIGVAKILFRNYIFSSDIKFLPIICMFIRFISKLRIYVFIENVNTSSKVSRFHVISDAKCCSRRFVFSSADKRYYSCEKTNWNSTIKFYF